MTSLSGAATVPVVRGRELVAVPDAEVDVLLAAAARVVVDVGTGDARAAYRLARADPDAVVVGMDPAWSAMAEVSRAARRKPERGGAPNLLLVAGSIETPPPVLVGRAERLWVVMPWGALLRGVVLGEPGIWGGLRSLAAVGARLDVSVDVSIWSPPIPQSVQRLPELTPEYVQRELAPAVAACGWQIHQAQVVTVRSRDDEVIAGSSWGRRLRAGATARVLHLHAEAT